MIIIFFKKNYISIILGLISIAGLYFISLYSYLLYHSFIELFSIVIAFGIFMLAWNSKKFLNNNYLLFVGIAYLFTALMDLFHTLSYKGMGVFTAFTGSNLATQLWISARYLGSISMFLALFFITRRLNYRLLFICYFIVTILIFLSIFYWKNFPVSYAEGSGLTTFKIISEYIISAILAAAIFFLYLYRKEFNRTVFLLIMVSLAMSILSELSFTLYLDVYGLFNQLGHFLKLLSFFLIYKAIIETVFSQPFDLLFFKLRQSEKDIRESEEKFRSLLTLNEERNKLARELHDTVTQTLFSANLIAEVIPRLWKKDPEAVIERLEEVRQLNNFALMEMRVLLYELRPSVLKDEDLGDLMQGLVKSVGARSKIPIKLIINGEYKFSPKIELGYYRIAQEALNNIIKHSYATKANLVLKNFPQNLYMEITDNGRGFDDKKIISTNLGLIIMRERAKLLGASLSIDSSPGKGTKITVVCNKKQTKKTD